MAGIQTRLCPALPPATTLHRGLCHTGCTAEAGDQVLSRNETSLTPPNVEGLCSVGICVTGCCGDRSTPGSLHHPVLGSLYLWACLGPAPAHGVSCRCDTHHRRYGPQPASTVHHPHLRLTPGRTLHHHDPWPQETLSQGLPASDWHMPVLLQSPSLPVLGELRGRRRHSCQSRHVTALMPCDNELRSQGQLKVGGTGTG